MSELYLLPCQCGKTVPVSVAQAGSQVQCGCGLPVEVPKMREIRALKPVPKSEVPVSHRDGENQYNGVTPQRAFFAICMCVGIIASIICGEMAFRLSQMQVAPPRDVEHVMDDRFVDGLTKTETLDVWMRFKKLGISGTPGSQWHETREEYARLKTLIKATGMIAGLGFLSAVLSTILMRPTAKT